MSGQRSGRKKPKSGRSTRRKGLQSVGLQESAPGFVSLQGEGGDKANDAWKGAVKSILKGRLLVYTVSNPSKVL